MSREDEKKTHQLSPAERVMILSIKKMGEGIALAIKEDSVLAAELAQLLQEFAKSAFGSIYVQAVEAYIQQRSITELVYSPFVVAFLETRLCKDHERELIAKLRKIDQQDISSELQSDFDEFLQSRKQLFASGLQAVVLNYGVLHRLSKSELSQRKGENLRQRMMQNPEAAKERQIAATQAAAELASPKTFTPEVRAFIQQLIEEGHSYAQVIKRLADEKHVSITERSLSAAVHRYRLPTSASVEKAKRDELLAALVEYHDAGHSVAETIKHFSDRYHRPYLIMLMSSKNLGLRDTINWRKPLKVDTEMTLEDLVREAILENHSLMQDEYQSFLAKLETFALSRKINVSAKTYFRKRKYILQSSSDERNT